MSNKSIVERILEAEKFGRSDFAKEMKHLLAVSLFPHNPYAVIVNVSTHQIRYQTDLKGDTHPFIIT